MSPPTRPPLNSLPFQLPPEITLKILSLLPQAPLVCKDSRLFFLWAQLQDYSGLYSNPWLLIGKYWLWFRIIIHENDKPKTVSTDSSPALRVPIPLILMDSNKLMIIEQILQLEISTSSGLRSRYNIQEAITAYQEKGLLEEGKKDETLLIQPQHLSFHKYMKILLPKLYEQVNRKTRFWFIQLLIANLMMKAVRGGGRRGWTSKVCGRSRLY
jgi:hypothetical protein